MARPRPSNKERTSAQRRCATRGWLAATVAANGWLAAGSFADTVERRGAEPTIVGDIVSMDDAGVTITTQFGARHSVPWDRVRHIDDDRPSSDLAARLALAEDLWRARSRVERHDTALAEPLLERLFYDRYLGQDSETALVVAEGLLRCRLARQEHALAVVPALEVARLRRANMRTDSYARLAPVYDGSTALCPALAPAWLPGRAVDRLQRELGSYNAHGDEVVAALASLYRAAAEQVAARSAEIAPTTAVPGHPGVLLMQQLVECAPGSGQASTDAAQRLASRLGDLPEWAQAWARYRIGLSMLGAEDRATQDAGLVQLIHVPAGFGRVQPYLAGLALHSIAETLAARGDTDAAAAVRTELARAFPDHPARAVLTAP